MNSTVRAAGWLAVALTGGLTAGWVWGQVYELARVASVAAPGLPVTWLRALAALLIAALTGIAILGCRAERARP